MSEPLQRTSDWHALRCGRVTGSRVADVIGTTKAGKWGAARAKYMEQLVAERLTGKPQDMRRIKSLDDRADMEPEAIACYEFYTGNKVAPVGFVPHPTIEMAGASPDGLVNDDGVIEVKNLDPATHAKLLRGDTSVMADYMPQMQFEIACTERKFCEFVAYCPTMPEELKMYHRRVERDREGIEGLETIILVFLGEVDAMVKEILFGLGARAGDRAAPSSKNAASA